MKTKIVIEVDTDMLKRIYDTPIFEEHTEDNDITDDVEEQLHASIMIQVNEYLQDSLESDVFDDIENLDIPEDYEMFNDFGKITIKIFKEEKEIYHCGQIQDAQSFLQTRKCWNKEVRHQ